MLGGLAQSNVVLVPVGLGINVWGPQVAVQQHGSGTAAVGDRETADPVIAKSSTRGVCVPQNNQMRAERLVFTLQRQLLPLESNSSIPQHQWGGAVWGQPGRGSLPSTTAPMDNSVVYLGEVSSTASSKAVFLLLVAAVEVKS